MTEPQAAAPAAPSVPVPPASLLSDPTRLRAVRRLLDAGGAESLDRLTGLAALLLDTDRAQVSLIAEQQHVAAAAGLPPEQRGPSPAPDSLCTATMELGGPLAVGDAPTDARVSMLPPVTSGQVRSYLGVPLVDRDGLALGALCVYDDEPRTWSPHDVGVLSELGASVVAELELMAVTEEQVSGSARLELALQAADGGAFDWHLDTGRLTWDDRLLELFDYTREDFDETIESFSRRLHPDDVERVAAVLAGSVERGEDLAVDYRVVRPDGSVRRLVARGRVVGRTDDRQGRLLGVAYDSTEALGTRDRLAQVLATMSDAFVSVDRGWHLTWVNAEGERLLGGPSSELVGRLLWEVEPGLAHSDAGERFRAAMAAGERTTFELAVEPTGRAYEVRSYPQADGLAMSLLDITDRRRAEQERERASQEREQAVVERERAYAAAEAATHRLALLADATTRLTASLDASQVLQALADTVVPELGTWMAVVMPAAVAGSLGDGDSGDSGLRVVLARHGQLGRSDELAGVLDLLALDPADERGPGAVLRTGRPDWISPDDADALVASMGDDDSRARLLALGTGPSLTLPLSSRGRRLATMTVAVPPQSAVDRALLADLAGRAAVALDNALLYGDERRTGLTLQRSLLPREVPQLPGIEVAVRYLPGATGAFVGGDWYQGIPVGDDLVLAIGDVMGHGMQSAARMGQLRAIVATLALEGHGPGALLTRLAASVDELLDLELATLLVARYCPGDRTLSLASAGHPPVLHAPLDRPPYFVDVAPGPPLGTFAGRYDEVVVDVAAQDTVVLFTDGLVETRSADLDTGLERLRQALVELRLPPEAVADHVLRTMGVTRGGADDVALLVFSHLPEDRHLGSGA